MRTGKLSGGGGYPFIDLCRCAKWKRMRILVKMQHLNDDLIGGRNYFSVAPLSADQAGSSRWDFPGASTTRCRQVSSPETVYVC
ncbi:MAG: putative porin [Alistipes indistinctus]